MSTNFDILETNDREVWLKISKLTFEHEGWIVGKQDYECYVQGFGPHNYWFLAAYDKESNELVGGVHGAHYPSQDGSPAMSSVGNFFLLPKYRGLGLGLHLFDRLLNNEKMIGQNQHLSSNPDMCQKYSEKFGFNKIMDWGLEAFKIATKSIDLNKIIVEKFKENYKFLCPQVEKVVPWSRVLEYDQKIYGGVRRDGYIRSVLSLESAVSQIVVDAVTNEVVGFGCIREAIEGSLLVSPWYANNVEIAKHMLYQMLLPYTSSKQRLQIGLAKSLNDYKQLVFCIPCTNKESKDVLKELNKGHYPTQYSFTYVNFTNYVIEVPVNKVFAIADMTMHIS